MEITSGVTFDAPSEGQYSTVVEIPGDDPRTVDDPVEIPAPSLRGYSIILAEVHFSASGPECSGTQRDLVDSMRSMPVRGESGFQ